MGTIPYPLSLSRRSRRLTESKALENTRYIRSTALPSSSHFAINSSATKRLFRVERRGRKPCCRENWDKWASIFSLRIASITLQTTDVRRMDLIRFECAVRGAIATGVTMAWRQSSKNVQNEIKIINLSDFRDLHRRSQRCVTIYKQKLLVRPFRVSPIRDIPPNTRE